MKSLIMGNFDPGPAFALLASILFLSSPVEAQSLPPAEQFDQQTRSCAAEKRIAVPDEFIASVSGVYKAVLPHGAPSFASWDQFSALFSDRIGPEGRLLYSECIARLITARAFNSVLRPRVCIQQYDLSGTPGGAEVIIGLDCDGITERVGPVQVAPLFVCGRLKSYEIQYDQKNGQPVSLRVIVSVGCVADRPPSEQGCVKDRGSCFAIKYKTSN
ncbi:hypothetical protein V1277_006312 [Bradyrhizobium sp. AZCC 1588]